MPSLQARAVTGSYPLEQGYLIPRRAAGNALTREFATYVASPAARTILTSYGFVLPDSAGGK